jgi:hypothetical protein
MRRALILLALPMCSILLWGRVLPRITSITPLAARAEAKAGPPNDDFANAEEITNQATSGTTIGATDEKDETLSTGSQGYTVWYKFNPPATSGYDVAIRDSLDFAPPYNNVHIYKGKTLAELELLARVEGRKSTALKMEAGQDYLFQVDGNRDGGQPFILYLNKAAENDAFASRIVFSEVAVPISGSTVGATREIGEPDHDGVQASRTVWWEFRPQRSGGFVISLDWPVDWAGLVVYIGTSLNDLAAVSSKLLRTQDNQPYKFFRAEAGKAYFIALYDTSSYPMTMQFRIEGPPANDDLANAIPLVGDSISGTTLWATSEPGEASSTGAGTTVWYRWIAPAEGSYALLATGGFVSVFTGEDSRPKPIPDYRSPSDQFPTFCFRAVAGEMFYFAVDASRAGPFTLRILPCAVNDDFANRIELQLGVTNRSPAFLATRESGEPPLSTNLLVNSLWWKWRAPVEGGYRVELPRVSGKAAATVFMGSEVGDLRPVGRAEGSDGTMGVDFYATAGGEYSIAFGQTVESENPVELFVKTGTANDNFTNAVSLQLGVTLTNIVSSATLEPGETAWAGIDHGTIWYRWTAPTDGAFYLAVAPPFAAMPMAIFTGTAVANLNPSKMITYWMSAGGGISFKANAGVTYHFALTVPSPDLDETLILSVNRSPANDDFTTPDLLTGEFVDWKGSTIGATTELDEPLAGFPQTDAASVWAKWIAPETGRFRLVRMRDRPEVFAGENIGSLTLLNKRFLTDGVKYGLEFDAEVGKAYYLRVITDPSRVGDFEVRLGLASPNDQPAGALTIDGTAFTVSGSTWTAMSTSFNAPSFIWWKWKAPGDGFLRPLTTGLGTSSGLVVQLFHDKLPTVDSNVFRPTENLIGLPLENVPFTGGVVTRGIDYLIAVSSGPPTTNVNIPFELQPSNPLVSVWQGVRPDVLRGGNTVWINETKDMAVGPSALEAAVKNGSDQAWLEATCYGPGTIQFWTKTIGNPLYAQWNVSVRRGNLSSSVARIQPGTNWAMRTIALDGWTNVVRWTFQGERLAKVPVAIGRLDGIVFTPEPLRGQLRLKLEQQSQDRYLLRLSGEQRMYRIEYSTNLVDWQFWTNRVIGSEVGYTVSSALSDPAGFFRATLPY